MADQAPTTVPGLTYVPNFINQRHEKQLLKFLDSQPWDGDFSSRRVQQYGYNLDFFNNNELTELDPIPEAFKKVIQKLSKEGYLPEEDCHQLIVNEYGRKQGIGKHVDCDVFGEIIVSLTLGDPCVLNMHESVAPPGEYNFKTIEETGRVVSHLLESRSIVVLKGDARWLWKHGIPKADRMEVGGTVIERDDDYRRVSVTFRSVVKDDPRILCRKGNCQAK